MEFLESEFTKLTCESTSLQQYAAKIAYGEVISHVVCNCTSPAWWTGHYFHQLFRETITITFILTSPNIALQMNYGY